MTRPAAHYVHDTVVVVPGALAARLWRVARLDEVRVAANGRDPALYELLVAIKQAAMRASSEVGSEPVPTSEPRPLSELITTQQAAERLNVTPRQVVKLLATGRLNGERDHDGRSWLIDPASVTTYLEERNP